VSSGFCELAGIRAQPSASSMRRARSCTGPPGPLWPSPIVVGTPAQVVAAVPTVCALAAWLVAAEGRLFLNQFVCVSLAFARCCCCCCGSARECGARAYLLVVLVVLPSFPQRREDAQCVPTFFAVHALHTFRLRYHLDRLPFGRETW